jgi:hypothetical protein
MKNRRDIFTNLLKPGHLRIPFVSRKSYTKSADYGGKLLTPDDTEHILNSRVANLNLNKKSLTLALRSTMVLVFAAVVMFTAFTSVSYARSCAKLTGFPGFLQRIGFVTAGPCVSKIGGTICSGGTACTVNNAAGTCKNTAGPGQAAVCTCVPNTVSNGL